MKLIVDQWEAVQHHYGFEAMIFHVAGSRNVHADIASRASAAEVHTKLTAVLREEFPIRALRQVPVVWVAGKARGNIIDELVALKPKF